MRWCFGEFTLDRERRELRRGGQPIGIQPKQLELLYLLLEQRPAAVAKEAIYDALWRDVVVEEANLHNLVADLRKILEDADHRWIRTVHRFGYAFSGEVAEEREARRASEWELRIGDKTFPLHEGPNVVGREDEADVSLDAPGISRNHARIIITPDGALLEDLGSKNGTFIRTQRVSSPTTIHEGESVVFARIAAVICKRRSKQMTVTEND